ncbi:hypothetical protein [Macrococcus sp. DPC7161]|uniref:hypothetical protein n=1 Tax=Macrococcus sp. DPC7161 TaxID=2507060 RepID=UPI00100AB1BA|nr:hypothetical protein [Macrococcus sp. DPC7161]RXK19074.1 hypothetical protein ER639_01810 [Macrococcus sp. DPC7161]
MTEVVTYLRVNINGKWTNLGIVADETEIKEHFKFVEDLLMQKERADELEKEKNDAVLALFNQKDYYGKLVSEEKQRADLLQDRWNDLTKKIEDAMIFIERELLHAKEHYSKDDIDERIQIQHLNSFHSGFENVRRKMKNLEIKYKHRNKEDDE